MVGASPLAQQRPDWPAHLVDDWDDIRAFAEVARLGTFRGAATRMNTSATTVARRVKALEERLGVKLVRRLAHGLKLTQAGERAANRANEIDLMIRRLHAEIGNEAGPQGHVRLAVSDGFGCYWLPEKVPEFSKQYPHVCLEIFCTNENPSVVNMEADLALIWQKPAAAELAVIFEMAVPFSLFASREYIRRHGAPKTRQDLYQHALLNRYTYPRDADWADWWSVVESHPRVTAITNSSMSLGYLTKFHAGITLHPTTVAQREPEFVRIDIEGFSPRQVYWLVCHREAKNIPRVRAVINFLRGLPIFTVRPREAE
jgi:DNA-binding transcriptional LysR family regulator